MEYSSIKDIIASIIQRFHLEFALLTLKEDPSVADLRYSIEETKESFEVDLFIKLKPSSEKVTLQFCRVAKDQIIGEIV